MILDLPIYDYIGTCAAHATTTPPYSTPQLPLLTTVGVRLSTTGLVKACDAPTDKLAPVEAFVRGVLLAVPQTQAVLQRMLYISSFDRQHEGILSQSSQLTETCQAVRDPHQPAPTPPFPEVTPSRNISTTLIMLLHACSCVSMQITSNLKFANLLARVILPLGNKLNEVRDALIRHPPPHPAAASPPPPLN